MQNDAIRKMLKGSGIDDKEAARIIENISARKKPLAYVLAGSFILTLLTGAPEILLIALAAAFSYVINRKRPAGLGKSVRRMVSAPKRAATAKAAVKPGFVRPEVKVYGDDEVVINAVRGEQPVINGVRGEQAVINGVREY